MMNEVKKVSVFMFGARMHYAVPIILHSENLLGILVNDLNADCKQIANLKPLLKYLPTSASRNLLDRSIPDVPKEKIFCNALCAVQLHLKRSMSRNLLKTVRAEIEACEKLSRTALKNGILDADMLFTYDRAGLELMEIRKKEGGLTVMEQSVAPADLYKNLLIKSKFGVGDATILGLDLLSQREKAEWTLADKIICGSRFVKSGLIKLGVNANKCEVVPYGVDPKQYTFRIRRVENSDAIKMLFVGSICFRKGVSYLLDAVRKVRGKVQLVMVGAIAEPDLLTNLDAQNITIVGSVPRSEVRNWMNWADMLIMPSLFEGSATVTYEALASGLPVMCTEETGSIVEHGVNGLIVESYSSEALQEAFNNLDGDTINQFSSNIGKMNESWGISSYKNRLISFIKGELTSNSSS